MAKTQDKPVPPRKTAAPLRITAAAVGAGLAWAALHVPAGVEGAGIATQAKVGIEAVTAILVALSIIRIGVAVITCATHITGPLIARARRP
ncbi:MAG TPA: hypothetical protein VF292_09450 [Rhodanobacteraceae bacterium]